MEINKDKKNNPIRNKATRISNKVKILLSGGGTGGSVSPLLAVAEECRMSNVECRMYEFLWIGTRQGPEKEMVTSAGSTPKDGQATEVQGAGIKFRPIVSGKMRRYFSFRNFIDPFFIFIGFIQSFFIILFYRPKLIMSAGSFVSVPIVWAGWVLGVKILIHQQDKRPGLANKLMAPFAKTITVTFKESLADYGEKAVWTGNPARRSREITNSTRLRQDSGGQELQITNNNLPIVLVVGGGTGADMINKLVCESLDELTKFCQIVHITGKNKSEKLKVKSKNYFSYKFLDYDEMMAIMKKADLVVSRAGLGFLTEISYFKKPAIIIPMPDTHQEDNAKVFADKQAVIVLDQNKLTKEEFINKIKELLNDDVLRNRLRNKIGEVMKPGANKAIVEIIYRITRNA